jgi:hypothetical protein
LNRRPRQFAGNSGILLRPGRRGIIRNGALPFLIFALLPLDLRHTGLGNSFGCRDFLLCCARFARRYSIRHSAVWNTLSPVRADRGHSRSSQIGNSSPVPRARGSRARGLPHGGANPSFSPARADRGPTNFVGMLDLELLPSASGSRARRLRPGASSRRRAASEFRSRRGSEDQGPRLGPCFGHHRGRRYPPPPVSSASRRPRGHRRGRQPACTGSALPWRPGTERAGR